MGRVFPEDKRPLKDRLDFMPNIPRIELSLLFLWAAGAGIGGASDHKELFFLSLVGITTSSWLYNRTTRAAEEIRRQLAQTLPTTEQMPAEPSSSTR